MTYAAPLDDIIFALRHIAGFDDFIANGGSPDFDAESLSSVLVEAGRFADATLAPLNRVGDEAGASLFEGTVTLPPGFADAYREWQAGGWNGLAQPQAWGGMGLPFMANTAAMEMWTSGCLALMMAPPLTQGACDALAAHADEDLKATYLPKLVSGEWTASMCLTEPQAGSDVGAVAARAEPRLDGSWRLFGSKIFISYGQHDATENIIHLVLARIPGAPAGTRGISLFLVPDQLVGEEGRAAKRNGVLCTGIEEKMGLHGSPTCSMSFEGSLGWLVGPPNQGLACMFAMMNRMRLGAGLQGVAIAERATQAAFAFAKERVQGQPPGAPPRAPIIAHPDVKRMLMTMRALSYAGRALAYTAARAIDDAEGAGEASRVDGEARAALLTPVVKAFCTDAGCEVASLCIQVHGGMGFVEETGVAQLLRDIRIAPIYEGANGIQAIDLVTRKVRKDGGLEVRRLLAEHRTMLSEAAGSDPLTAACRKAMQGLEDLAHATDHILRLDDPTSLLAVATPYLRLFALAVGGSLLIKGAHRGLLNEPGTPAALRMVDAACFYASNLSPETRALAEVVSESGVCLMKTHTAWAD